MSHSAWHRVAVGWTWARKRRRCPVCRGNLRRHVTIRIAAAWRVPRIRQDPTSTPKLKRSGRLGSLHVGGQTARFLPVGVAGDDRRVRTCANSFRNRAGDNCPGAATRTPRCRIPTRRWRRSQGIHPCHAFRPTSTTPQNQPVAVYVVDRVGRKVVGATCQRISSQDTAASGMHCAQMIVHGPTTGNLNLGCAAPARAYARGQSGRLVAPAGAAPSLASRRDIPGLSA